MVGTEAQSIIIQNSDGTEHVIMSPSVLDGQSIAGLQQDLDNAADGEGQELAQTTENLNVRCYLWSNCPVSSNLQLTSLVSGGTSFFPGGVITSGNKCCGD